MQFSGNLEDVPIIDVLQILGLAGRSGTLQVRNDDQQAELTFHRGKIVAARLTPSNRFMVDALLDAGTLSLETLHRALQIQKSAPEGERTPIGGILLDLKAITRGQLRDALTSYIQSIVNTLATWSDGEFEFALGAALPADDLRILPAQVALDLDIRPQELLLEAARLIDHACRDATEGQDAEDVLLDRLLGGGDAEPTPVVLVSHDLLIQHALRQGLESEPVEFHAARDPEAAAGTLMELADREPLVVLDLDDLPPVGDDGDSPLARFRRQWFALPLITVGAPGAAVDADVVHVWRPTAEDLNDSAILQRFAESLIVAVQTRVAAAKPAPGAEAVAEDPLDALYRRVLEFREHRQSATVSLEVLRYVADYLDRALLWLVDHQQLVALGLFGVECVGPERDLRAQLEQLRLSRLPWTLFEGVVQQQQLRVGPIPPNDAVLNTLYAHIGRPAQDEIAVLPIVVRERVIALIYADNGDQPRSVGSVAPLGILAEHGSLMLENLLLRRQLHTRRDGDQPEPLAGVETENSDE